MADFGTEEENRLKPQITISWLGNRCNAMMLKFSGFHFLNDTYEWFKFQANLRHKGYMVWMI